MIKNLIRIKIFLRYSNSPYERRETAVVWDPEQYTRGNFFQNEVSEAFRKRFSVEPFGDILDIGCGDGQFINSVANNIKHGHILGIDSSTDMVRHAYQHWSRKNLTFETHRIEDFQQSLAFDFALSFWCLHWTDITVSFPNIFHALKNEGRMYAVFSSFSDNSILQTWHELAKQNRYSVLTDRYNKSSNQYRYYFYHVLNTLSQLPFKQIKLHLETTRTYLPNIDYFKNLLLTMPFMKTFPAEIIDDLIEEMLITFQNMCQKKYGGKLYYETRPIFLEAIK